MLREGAHASYVGPEEEGREIGDRCYVLSLETRLAHVRWVTGARQGGYEAVLHGDLVADLVPQRFDDEFTFESNSGRLVNIACLDVLTHSGPRGLISALTKEGVLSSVPEVARMAVAHLRDALAADPAWLEIRADLGEQGVGFERVVLQHLLASAMDDQGSAPVADDTID